MATCRECLHYDACVLNEAYWVKHNADQPCSEFKDKSRYVEQKHGRWENVTGGMIMLGDCSECKVRQPVSGTNYCQNCGAKMDDDYSSPSASSNSI